MANLTETQKQSFIGCVKWFNNKTGFGFITIINDCEHKGKDIFTHHSFITITESLNKDKIYKYLVQGEYVEFNIQQLENNTENKHEIQAVNIRGILGYPLMCETRHLNTVQTNKNNNFTNIRKPRHKIVSSKA